MRAALLVFALRGPAQSGLLTLADDMRRRGARVLLIGPSEYPQSDLPVSMGDAEELDPIIAIQSFYAMVEALASVRYGQNAKLFVGLGAPSAPSAVMSLRAQTWWP